MYLKQTPMKRDAKKLVKVMTGTEIALCSPSHPYTMAVQVKRVLDRIAVSADSEFEYSCNIPAGIKAFEVYGRSILGLNIVYYINGKIASYDDVLADLKRSDEYLDQLKNMRNESI